jgi:hypothetical protein
MRASEEHNRHTNEMRRLLEELKQKNASLVEVTAGEPIGAAAIEKHAVLVARNKDVRSAQEAVMGARAALDEHAGSSMHFVRNYRVLELGSKRELHRFTADYELAPWKASKHMADQHVYQFDLQEEQPDGSWLPYYPD